jgi:hypothetical protein
LWKRFNNVFDISSGTMAFYIFVNFDEVFSNFFDSLGASGGEILIDFIFSGLASTFFDEIVEGFIEQIEQSFSDSIGVLRIIGIF